MAEVTLKGNPIRTFGELPAPGTKAPDFVLTTGDLRDVSLSEYAGKTKIINIVPSLDTSTCAASARRFNIEAAKLSDTVVLTVSCDLPFAQKRFCEAEGIANVVTLSQMRNDDFGRAYGVAMVDGPLAGILARAIVVAGPDNTVKHVQLVPEIAEEPDYEAALRAAAGPTLETAGA